VFSAVADRPCHQIAAGDRRKKETDMNSRKAIIATVVLAAAVLAPSAFAAQRPDDRAGTRGPGMIVALQSSSIRPDDRAGLHGPGTYGSQPAGSTAVRPDNRAGIRGPGELVSSNAQAAATSFDWQDAFIGGVGGVGITLLLIGLLFVVSSRRSRARAA
jgi:hypothetical protein